MKKAITLLCLVMIAVMAVTGCSSDKGGTPSEKTGATAAGSAESTSGDKSGNEAVNTDKPVEFELMAYFVMNVSPEDAILQEIKKKFNATIKPTITNISNYQQTLSMRIASGDIPDWFRATDQNLFNQLVEDKALLNVTEYANKFGFRNIVDQCQKPMANMLATKGQFYRVPDSLGHLNPGFYVREDWMKKLGLNAPETFDDFKGILKAFIDNDPDGKGTTGLTTYGNWSIDRFAPAWTGYYGWGRVNDKLTWFHADPNYKEALKYWADLYKNKLLDPEVLTNSYDKAMQKFASGRAGVLCMNMVQIWWDANEKPLKQYKADAELGAFVPVPSGPKGSFTSAGGIPYYADSCFSAKADEETKVRMLAVMDYLLSEEGRMLTLYGLEGQHHKVENGQKVQLTDVITKEWGQGQHLLGEVADFGSNDLIATSPVIQKWFQWQDQPGVVQNDWASMFSTDETAKIMASIGEVDNKWLVEFLLGETDIDANWDTYVGKLKEAGLDKWTQLVEKYLADNDAKIPEF